MPDLVDQLARRVAATIGALGFSEPNAAVVQSLIQTAFLASLKTEEGRFVRGSITFSDPAAPHVSPPLLRRADYPDFTKFDRRQPLTVESFVKLARAIDKWSASIAVWGTTKANLVTWGVIDQRVQHNVQLNLEGKKGFGNPGILIIDIDGVGDLSAYHGRFFLGALRGQRLVTRENDVIRSSTLVERISPSLAPFANGITHALQSPKDNGLVLKLLCESWSDTVARLCIGLRRLGTGGSFLITPTPVMDALDVTYGFRYRRLGNSLALQVLDSMYLSSLEEERWESRNSSFISNGLVTDLMLAEADVEDRESELGGAVKVVTSLAAADGLVLMTPELLVTGFGVKIGSGPTVATVYDGSDFTRKGKQARKIKLSGLGTRHTSMMRYCRIDPSAVGIVVSQDGHVRLIMSYGRSVTLWDDVKLLGYNDYSPRAARRERNRRATRARHPELLRLGYTPTPKTIAALLSEIPK